MQGGFHSAGHHGAAHMSHTLQNKGASKRIGHTVIVFRFLSYKEAARATYQKKWRVLGLNRPRAAVGDAECDVIFTCCLGPVGIDASRAEANGLCPRSKKGAAIYGF